MINHEGTIYRIIFWRSGSGNHKESWNYEDIATERCAELKTLGARDIHLYRVEVTEIPFQPPDPAIIAHFEKQKREKKS